ncbi:MAG: 3-phosphoshikimate 1-carboxyvinyltransferase [Clostridia bacterium]|nr:3-phosphoshikimate 1-carboxyvinyltransferase [Clostridia bacterium]
MMRARLKPFRARGTVDAPVSKSAAHRLLILAALCPEKCRVYLSRGTDPEKSDPSRCLSAGEDRNKIDGVSDDIRATLSCLSALGCDWTVENGVCTLPPIAKRAGTPVLDCGESGSTLRFLLPVALGLGGAEMTGRGRLPLRPMDDLLDALEKEGAVFSARRLPFKAEGRFGGGEFLLPGNVSSQYLTGLLLASPLAEKDTLIRLKSPLESAAYVDMTLDALELFGIRFVRGADFFLVPGSQRLKAPEGGVRVEGDWSGAAFPLCLGALGGDVTVRGLKADSRQGDRAILRILSDMGAVTETDGDRARAARGGLHGTNVDVSGIPDMVPALAAVMMHARGESRLFNAARLRLKESDRLKTVCTMVNALGGDAAIRDDSLIIRGRETVPGGRADGAADHRIVMAAAVAASACAGESSVSDPGALNKSYPAFPDDIRRLGGIFDVVDLG